jgi:hypothetical protein
VEGLETRTGSTGGSTEAVTNGFTNASAPTFLETSVERSMALVAYNTRLLGPLTAVIERQQAEQVGNLRAQLAPTEERNRALEAPGTHVAVNLPAQAGETTPVPSHRPRGPEPSPMPAAILPGPTGAAQEEVAGGTGCEELIGDEPQWTGGQR